MSKVEFQEKEFKEVVQKVPFHWRVVGVFRGDGTPRSPNLAIARANRHTEAYLGLLLRVPLNQVDQVDVLALPLDLSALTLSYLPISMISQLHPLLPWLLLLFLLCISASFLTLLQLPLLPPLPVSLMPAAQSLQDYTGLLHSNCCREKWVPYAYLLDVK